MDDALAGLLRPLIDQELAIVFYDLTTIRAEGSTDESEDLRHVGHAKEGGTVRQVMLGVVQTAEGLPIHHEVFAGNTGETTTLVPTIEKVLARYPIKRVVLVADPRGNCTASLIAPNLVLTARHCVAQNVTQGIGCDINGKSTNGDHAGNNYAVTYAANNTSNITAAPLSVTGVTAANRVYDGTVDVALGGTAAVTQSATDHPPLTGSVHHDE